MSNWHSVYSSVKTCNLIQKTSRKIILFKCCIRVFIENWLWCTEAHNFEMEMHEYGEDSIHKLENSGTSTAFAPPS
jgi:hypothetical protein